MERAIVSLAAEQQPRAAQKEVLVSEREGARRAAAQREAEVEVKLREVQQLQDQLAAKVSVCVCGAGVRVGECGVVLFVCGGGGIVWRDGKGISFRINWEWWWVERWGLRKSRHDA